MEGKFLVFSCVVAVAGILFINGKIVSAKNLNDVNHCWDYFMLVQRWPYSTCQIVNASGSPCTIPMQVNSWTLHGLWPDNINTYPFNCNDEKFNVSYVEDIKEELLLKWPNLYAMEAVDSLWKHEFEKHGTCAQSLPTFSKQKNYFTKTLDYFDKWNVADVLEENGIFPREEPYHVTELIDIIKSGYKAIICPGCGHIEGFGQILSQVYMCIDKNDTMVNCPVCEKQCDDQKPVYYQPNHPHLVKVGTP